MTKIEEARARLLIAKMRWDRDWNTAFLWDETYKAYERAKYDFVRAHCKGGVLNLRGHSLNHEVQRLLDI